MPDLIDQIQSFSLTLMLGIVLGAIIHYYQLTIRKGRLRKYFLYALDFILWIILMALIFVCLLLINLGEMRAYVFIALLSGTLIYYRFAARYCHDALSIGAQATVVVFSLGKDYVCRPLKWGLVKIRNKIFMKPRKENPPDE